MEFIPKNICENSAFLKQLNPEDTEAFKVDNLFELISSFPKFNTKGFMTAEPISDDIIPGFPSIDPRKEDNRTRFCRLIEVISKLLNSRVVITDKMLSFYHKKDKFRFVELSKCSYQDFEKILFLIEYLILDERLNDYIGYEILMDFHPYKSNGSLYIYKLAPKEFDDFLKKEYRKMFPDSYCIKCLKASQSLHPMKSFDIPLKSGNLILDAYFRSYSIFSKFLSEINSGVNWYFIYDKDCLHNQ